MIRNETAPSFCEAVAAPGRTPVRDPEAHGPCTCRSWFWPPLDCWHQVTIWSGKKFYRSGKTDTPQVSVRRGRARSQVCGAGHPHGGHVHLHCAWPPVPRGTWERRLLCACRAARERELTSQWHRRKSRHEPRHPGSSGGAVNTHSLFWGAPSLTSA